MDIGLLLLRLVHVFGGVFWVGGSLMMNFFVGPTIRNTAQAGQQFAGHLIAKTRLVVVMSTAALLTILAGALLYWRDSQGFTSAWAKSGPGIGYAVGGVAGLIGAIFGIMFGVLNSRLVSVAMQAKGQPTPEQLGKMQDIQKKIMQVTPIHVTSVIIAAVFMATARYFVF